MPPHLLAAIRLDCNAKPEHGSRRWPALAAGPLSKVARSRRWPALAESGSQRTVNEGWQAQRFTQLLLSPLALLCHRPRRCRTTCIRRQPRGGGLQPPCPATNSHISPCLALPGTHQPLSLTPAREIHPMNASIAFGALQLVVGLGATYLCRVELRLGWASRRWPQTTGRICEPVPENFRSRADFPAPIFLGTGGGDRSLALEESTPCPPFPHLSTPKTHLRPAVPVPERRFPPLLSPHPLFSRSPNRALAPHAHQP